MSTFEELNKKTFFELVKKIYEFPDQKVECKHFISLSSHFSASKQNEIVLTVIDKGIDPRTNKDCKRAKNIIIEILVEIYKKNSHAKM
jgi:hypothetical protein